MVLRQNVKCATCGKVYTYRICIGHADEQKHNYVCIDCGETIYFSLSLDQKNAGWKANYGENAEVSESEGLIVNMHSEFIVPEELLHKDRIFLNLMMMQEMYEKVNPESFKDESFNREDAKKNYRDLYLPEKEWESLKKAWSQFTKGRRPEAQKIAHNFKGVFPEAGDGVEHWVFSFAMRALAPSMSYLFHDAMELIVEIRKGNEAGFKEFLTFHNENILPSSLKKQFTVFKGFYKSYQDFSQYYLSYKRNGKIEGGKVSSCTFDETAQLYGNMFEVFGAGLVTFACLSNLHKGRSFDQFENITFNLT